MGLVQANGGRDESFKKNIRNSRGERIRNDNDARMEEDVIPR
jgi:hypothetical protein